MPAPQRRFYTSLPLWPEGLTPKTSDKGLVSLSSGRSGKGREHFPPKKRANSFESFNKHIQSSLLLPLFLPPVKGTGVFFLFEPLLFARFFFCLDGSADTVSPLFFFVCFSILPTNKLLLSCIGQKNASSLFYPFSARQSHFFVYFDPIM